jgi:hypothetical protein
MDPGLRRDDGFLANNIFYQASTIRPLLDVYVNVSTAVSCLLWHPLNRTP